MSEQGKACRERQNLLLIEEIWLGKEKKKEAFLTEKSVPARHSRMSLRTGLSFKWDFGRWAGNNSSRLGKVSAALLSIASSLIFLRMFFLKSLFHFSLKNGWKIRFYWWKNCTWGFAFTHVFYGNKSAATWLLFLVVLILFGLVTQC